MMRLELTTLGLEVLRADQLRHTCMKINITNYQGNNIYPFDLMGDHDDLVC